MEKHTVIAPVGDNLGAIYVGIKEIPTEKLILITPAEKLKEATNIKNELAKFKIPVQIKQISGNMMEAMFQAFAEIKEVEGERKFIVNVASGDRMSTCAALSAAFVNGFRAFGVMGDKAMLLPVLKFSYYKMLTDKKLGILKALHGSNGLFLEELGRKLKMSLPLLSYHVNGNLKSEGLIELGLIETTEVNGRAQVALTTMGKLLIKGYVRC